MKKTIIFSTLLSATMFFVAGCGGTTDSKPDKNVQTEAPTETASDKSTDNSKLSKLTKNKIDAVITLTNGETIEIELYPDVAPKTVANFVKNVQEGFYSQTIFHRAIDGFVVQGGGYDTEYNSKTVSETVEGEFSDNGTENVLSHKRGVISMARIPSQPDSASTQFFIVQSDSEYLDGQYAAFGMVRGGMNVIDEIAASPHMKNPPSGLTDLPEEQFVIESITIESDETDVDEDTPSNNQL